MKIPVGKDDFDKIRRNHSYYVDKTELLYDLVNGTDNEVTLFTRPRRFGKTLMMSMMESFFSIQKGDSRDVFEGLNIMKHEAFCAEWMNQYPVLFLTFKGVEALCFNDAYKTLQVKLSELCIIHRDLLNDSNVAQVDKSTYQKLMEKKADLAEIKDSLKTIMRMMAAVYEKPVILLIDEYDVPLTKASEQNTGENPYYKNMLDVIRGMFDAALKGNEFLNLPLLRDVCGLLKTPKACLGRASLPGRTTSCPTLCWLTNTHGQARGVA